MIFVFCLGLQAQQEVYKQRIDFIRKNLILSKEETFFWQIYEKYLQTEYSIHSKFRESMKSKGFKQENQKIHFEDKAPEEIYIFFDARMERKKALYELEEQFYTQIKKILKSQNLAKYYQLEKAFQKQAVEQKLMDKK